MPRKVQRFRRWWRRYFQDNRLWIAGGVATGLALCASTAQAEDYEGAHAPDAHAEEAQVEGDGHAEAGEGHGDAHQGDSHGEGHGDDHGGHHSVGSFSDITWFGLKEGMEHRLHYTPVGAQFTNLLLFVGLIVLLAGGGIKASFQNRTQSIQASIETSQAAFKKAEAYHQEYTSKLAKVDTEVGSLVEGAIKDGAREAKDLVAKAEDYAKQIEADAKTAMEREGGEVAAKLRLQLVDSVLSEGRKKLDGALGGDARGQLLEQAIVALEGGVKVGGKA